VSPGKWAGRPLHLGPSVRIFAEVQSGLEFGRNGGPRPAIDEDKLDVSQLFLELRSSTQQHKIPIEVRVAKTLTTVTAALFRYAI